jgi:hypothetical protein
MRDARAASLLDFAIAASIAVVPVLLAVLLSLGAVAPSGTGDSHVSVRQIAALKTFERAIVRRDTVQAPAPDAQALITLLPECGGEWGAQERALARVKEIFGRAAKEARTPAQRIAGELGELDEALLRMSVGGNRRVVDAVGFDAVRWAEAARQALTTPVETPRYRGQTFNVRCADLAAAVAMLSRGGGRMLATLAWRGTEVDRTVASWQPGQYVEISAHNLARANPWRGLPGCVYLANGGADGKEATPAFFVKTARAAGQRVCTQPAVFAVAAGENGAAAPVAIVGEPGPDVAADDLRWDVPPSLQALLQPLEALQRPWGPLYRSFTAVAAGEATAGERYGSNRITLDGAQVDVGFSVDLTIDPTLQALAQKTAACYTGRQDVCRALGIHRGEDGTDAIGHRLLERAVVRMAAVAIVDVASGRIDALAGSLSSCTRQEYDGPGRAANCDARLPYSVRYRPDALLNPAVFHDAMPGSVIKPVMAAAFLSNANVGSRWLAAERAAMRTSAQPTADSLRGQLMRSDSARFLDRMFCGDQGFRPCERPWEVQAMASAFGWNGGCADPSERCYKRDLLFGRSAAAADPDDLESLAEWVPYGRLLVEPSGGRLGAPSSTRAAIGLDTAKVRRCAAGADGRQGSKDDWAKCSGGVVVDIVAEGWGQGHARSTALGVAGMMAALAAAANGQNEVRKPHLVQAVRAVANAAPANLGSAVTRWTAAGSEPNALSRDAAEVILSGLSYSHRNGTARLACEQVLEPRACREIDWIAGKTGTPTFPNDDRSLDELAKLCAPGVQRTAVEQKACGGLRPYKWYVAAYRTDPANPAWTKVIGVLTERNWLADSGRIHGAGDHGPNPAAEIAFQVVARHTGVLAGDGR